MRLLSFSGWKRFWQVLAGCGSSGRLLAGALGSLFAGVVGFVHAEPGHAVPGQVEMVRAEDAVRFCERAWFERAYAHAETEATRQHVVCLATAAAREELKRSAWLDEVDCLKVAWSRPADSAPAGQPAGWLTWADQTGFHVVNPVTGRPAWGGGGSEWQPLFPRNHGLEGTPLLKDTVTGPLAVAAGRLFGVVALRMAGQLVPEFVALDLAPTAEGRLIWYQQLASPTMPPVAGLAADALLCVVACEAVEPNFLVRAMAASDGRLVWQQTVSQGQPVVDGAGPLVVLYQHLVVLVLPTGQLLGLDRADGRPVWQQNDLRDLLASSPGIVVDAVVGCADRLVVLLRSAGGWPQLVHIAGSHGGMLGRSRLVLEGGVVAGSAAPEPTPEMLRSESRNATRLGPPTVLAGRVVWPVRPTAGSPPDRLLMSEVAPGIKPFAGQQAPAEVVVSLRQIKGRRHAERLPPPGRAEQRLGVLTRGRLWCLGPDNLERTEEPSVP